MTILFPNKRAGLFLAEELSRLITRPVWMPEIMTLGEFIGQFTGLRQAETLPLSIKLYKAYASISGSKERFDDFYFWGNMLLGDFDDIDKYLVDARDLFSNLSALKDLENNFPYLNEEQIAAIKKFWSSFHTGTCSREQQEFLQIWDKLYDTYTLFRSSLFEQQLCYEGMNERFFCEHVHEYELHSKRILFAGFNALNRCESCGAHFRVEYQTEDGEAKRNDAEYSYAAVWEYAGDGQPPILHKEPITHDEVKPVVRSYK